METTGQRIKRLRIAKQLSQDELAHLVGYAGRSTISKIEKGEFDINISEANKWAKALGVPIQVFMGFNEDGTTPEEAGIKAAHLLADPKVMRLVNSYLIMSPKQQAVIDSLCVQFTGED